MRSSFVRAGAMVALLVAACGALNAGKVTTDPNTGPAPKPPAASVDVRLTQKVTCQTGYGRLHAILEELTTRTGVAVRAGNNTQDWKVRDIPVFVDVRDVTLTKLLSALTGAAHVQLTCLRLEGEKEKERTYRLYRTKTYQDSISQPVQQRLAKGMELAKWSWDALVAYSRMDNPPALPPSNELGMDSREVGLVGKVLSSLDQDTRQRILSGEACTLTCKDGPQSAPVKQLQQVAWEKLKRTRPQNYVSDQPNPEDAVLAIHVHQVQSDGYSGFTMMMGGFPKYEVESESQWGPVGKPPQTIKTKSMQTSMWYADGFKQAKLLENVKELNLPKRPEVEPSRVIEDPVPAGFKPLKSDDDWKNPLLRTKVKIAQPKDPEDCKCSDVLAQVARSSGLNIVCQDIRSHKTPSRSGIDFTFSAEPTAAEVLRALKTFDWFLDEPNRLLVGWEHNWRMFDNVLVPEELLSRLRARLASDGVELDDYLPLVKLGGLQFEWWIDASREFNCLQACIDTDTTPLWLLYERLSAEDRKLAMSEEGLPIAKVDPAWVSSFLRQEFERLTRGSIILSAAGEPAKMQLMRKVCADPDALRESLLRVMPTSCAMTYTITEGGGPPRVVVPKPPKPGEKHFYKIELTGKKDGEYFQLASSLQVAFPVRKGDTPAGHAVRVETTTPKNNR